MKGVLKPMLQIGFKCNRGVVRKSNEDACFVIPNQDVYIVADGVGGNNSGEIASSTAVESLASFVKANDLGLCGSPDEIFGFFTEALPTEEFSKWAERILHAEEWHQQLS